jgi:hypothetical protein
MLGKRRMLESVVKHGSRMARSLWVKLNCLNSNLDLVYGDRPSEERLKTMPHSALA